MDEEWKKEFKFPCPDKGTITTLYECEHYCNNTCDTYVSMANEDH